MSLPTTKQIPETLDLYAAYALEREGLNVIRMEHGFLTYKFEKPDILFVNDVYVSPDKRGGSTYLKLAQCAEQIGYEAGCKHMMGVVYLNTNNPSLSIKSILAYGLSPISADQGKIFFRKDIHAQSI